MKDAENSTKCSNNCLYWEKKYDLQYRWEKEESMNISKNAYMNADQ